MICSLRTFIATTTANNCLLWSIDSLILNHRLKHRLKLPHPSHKGVTLLDQNAPYNGPKVNRHHWPSVVEPMRTLICKTPMTAYTMELACQLSFLLQVMDRDVNAGKNMAMLCWRQLKGLPRPVEFGFAFQRKQKELEAHHLHAIASEAETHDFLFLVQILHILYIQRQAIVLLITMPCTILHGRLGLGWASLLTLQDNFRG